MAQLTSRAEEESEVTLESLSERLSALEELLNGGEGQERLATRRDVKRLIKLSEEETNASLTSLEGEMDARLTAVEGDISLLPLSTKELAAVANARGESFIEAQSEYIQMLLLYYDMDAKHPDLHYYNLVEGALRHYSTDGYFDKGAMLKVLTLAASDYLMEGCTFCIDKEYIEDLA